VDSNGFTAAYDPAAPGSNITQTSFNVRCSRSTAGDAASTNFAVVVNNGNNPQGQNNRASFGGNFIRYDTYKDAACATKWKGATTITGSVSMPVVGQQFTTTLPFWGCILPGQGPPAGTYTDIVVMTVAWGIGQNATGSLGVTITTPPVCSISSAPATLTMNYTSFGPAANGATSFGVTCTLGLPYTMALDAGGGTVLGLNYTVSLPTTASSGTGVQQTHAINGAIAPGQSGTCGAATCTGNGTRNVTLTY
jgi:spore coat protein U-like protein